MLYVGNIIIVKDLRDLCDLADRFGGDDNHPIIQNCHFVHDMKRFCGHKAEIIYMSGAKNRVSLKFMDREINAGNCYSFSPNMLMLVPKKEKHTLTELQRAESYQENKHLI